jgi:predicted phage terminase large subunit-like protein
MIPKEIVKLTASDFRLFVKRMWPAVSSDQFVDGYHLSAICEHLQAVADGQIKRLAINVAVRHSKSLLCSVLWPCFLWTRQPSSRIITASYSQVLTVRDAVRSRQLLESELYQRYFGPVSFVEDTNRKDYYQNTSKGHRLSVSITSRTAGFDADYIVADDIHDWATRTSQTERDKAADYFETGLMSRFVRKDDERAVVCGHKVHEDDVYSRLRAKYADDGTWTWLVLPEEYTPKYSAWFNGIGWRDKRAEGELLWPERFDEKVIQQEKKRYRHEYSAIFQQEAVPADGTLFKPDWFRHWTTETVDGAEFYVLGERKLAKEKAWRFVVVDTAISTSASADYTVIQVWDVIGPYLILVHQVRKKLDGNRIVPTITEVYETYQPQFVAVEKQFVGAFVIDQLRQANVLVKAFDAKRYGDKEQRAIAGEIRMEAGQVWFPAEAEYLAALQSELLGFPNAAHDDQVDGLSMAAALADKYKSRLPEELTPEEAAERAKAEAAEKFNRLLWQGCPY